MPTITTSIRAGRPLLPAEVHGRIVLVGGVAAAAIGFALPLSTALMNILAALVFLCWLLSGAFLDLPEMVRKNQVALSALLLFFALFAGMFYSTAPLPESFAILKKYRKLLLLVVLMPFLGDVRVRGWAMAAFIAGSGIALVHSYGVGVGLFPLTRWGASIMSPITHSVLISFLAYYAAQKAINTPSRRWLWALLSLVALVNVLFIVTGRTGQVIAIALMALFICHYGGWRRRIISLILLALVLAGGFAASERFRGLVVDTVDDISEYQQGETFTDVGLRLEFYNNSLELVMKRPVFGSGTGSFAGEYAALAGEKGIVATDNPHNEYLNLGVQLGLAGVGLFFVLLAVQWWAAGRMEDRQAMTARALIVAMALGCLANSFLMDSHEGNFYAFFSALFFSGGWGEGE